MNTGLLLTSALLMLMHLTTVTSRSIDEVIAAAANNSSTQLDAPGSFETFDPKTRTIRSVDEDGNCEVTVELDIKYTCEEWDELIALNNSSDAAANGREKRSAAIRPGWRGGKRWLDNTIHWQYGNGYFSSRDKSEIEAAMDDWSKYTCLTFTQSRNAKNRIYYENSRGCDSKYGMQGGAQKVGLARRGCRHKELVLHELGHTIGLFHEHTRPDRDQYVRILSQNVEFGMIDQFKKWEWNDLQDMGVPYDYYSVMQYGGKYFSSDGKRKTIETIDPQYQDVIGKPDGLSFGDIKTVNLMYNCKRATSGCTKSDDECPGQGFVSKDCECWCPGEPYRLCGDPAKKGCYTGDITKYDGTLATTEGGRTCQRWDTDSPHDKWDWYTPSMFPENSFAHNYCRYTPDEPRPWCYTTDPSTRWEFCDVPTCE